MRVPYHLHAALPRVSWMVRHLAASERKTQAAAESPVEPARALVRCEAQRHTHAHVLHEVCLTALRVIRAVHACRRRARVTSRWRTAVTRASLDAAGQAGFATRALRAAQHALASRLAATPLSRGFAKAYGPSDGLDCQRGHWRCRGIGHTSHAHLLLSSVCAQEERAAGRAARRG